MKKIFTFLVAFLATMSGAVWGQEHGSLERPLDISNYNDALLIDLDDCSGNYYITTNGRTNTYGIKVGGSDDVLNPANVTIYLINAKFDVGGSAIIVGTGEMPDIHTDIIRFVNLELVLIGENEITSDGSAAAIKLRNGDNVKLTISEKSTGILNINMTGDEPINQVAIGERGEEGLLWQDALHDCGSLTINGGTIVTNGYIGEFDSHAFRMNGNGIVVAKNIETSDIHKNWLVDNGIYYEKEEDGQNALNVKGDVTISSPIPDENVYVGEGNSLTLGRGDVLDADKVKIDNSKVKALYDKNKAQFVEPAQVKARHILVKSDAEAKEIISELGSLKGSALTQKFEELARSKSIDPGSASRGGDLGWFGQQDMVKPFSDAAFSLKNGTFTRTPVKTQYGFHVILKEDSKARKQLTLSDASVKNFIENQLKIQEVQQLMNKKAMELFQGAKVEIK